MRTLREFLPLLDHGCQHVGPTGLCPICGLELAEQLRRVVALGEQLVLARRRVEDFKAAMPKPTYLA